MRYEGDTNLRELRLHLGEQIARENDAHGTDGSLLSEAEAQAVLLAVMDGRSAVSQEELQKVVRQFEEAKANWLALRATLSGHVTIRLENGELQFRMGAGGYVVRPPHPHQPFETLPGMPPALGEG
jgi:hypothetical protein